MKDIKTTFWLFLTFAITILVGLMFLQARQAVGLLQEIVVLLGPPTPGPIIIVEPAPGDDDPAAWDIKENNVTHDASFGRSREMRRDAFGYHELLKATPTGGTEMSVRTWTLRVNKNGMEHTITVTNENASLVWLLDGSPLIPCTLDYSLPEEDRCLGELPDEFNGVWIEMKANDSVDAERGRTRARSTP